MAFRLLCIALALSISGCPLAPGSRMFAPEGPLEKKLFPYAKRDVFPHDVRKDPAAHRATVLLWSGIIKSAEAVPVAGGTGLRLVIEHHYWDFIEDYSIQRAIAFLSPRGEGTFEALFAFAIPAERVRPQDMAIVYGSPIGAAGSADHVILDGAVLRTLPRDKYATDIWDYGRDWLTRGDKADFRVLRTPLR